MDSQYQPYSSYRGLCDQGIPSPSLNGGLYVGKPFDKNAPWANIPVTPDTGYMMYYNLQSANPPPEAATHYPGTIRPGNNEPIYKDVQKKTNNYNLACSVPLNDFVPRHKNCNCTKCKLSKYAYL
jgi:hypothetical protein